MKDVEKTIGNLIDKQKIAFIGSVDIEGFPNIKAMLNSSIMALLQSHSPSFAKNKSMKR